MFPELWSKIGRVVDGVTGWRSPFESSWRSLSPKMLEVLVSPAALDCFLAYEVFSREFLHPMAPPEGGSEPRVAINYSFSNTSLPVGMKWFWYGTMKDKLDIPPVFICVKGPEGMLLDIERLSGMVFNVILSRTNQARRNDNNVAGGRNTVR